MSNLMARSLLVASVVVLCAATYGCGGVMESRFMLGTVRETSRVAIYSSQWISLLNGSIVTQIPGESEKRATPTVEQWDAAFTSGPDLVGGNVFKTFDSIVLIDVPKDTGSDLVGTAQALVPTRAGIRNLTSQQAREIAAAYTAAYKGIRLQKQGDLGSFDLYILSIWNAAVCHLAAGDWDDFMSAVRAMPTGGSSTIGVLSLRNRCNIAASRIEKVQPLRRGARYGKRSVTVGQRVVTPAVQMTPPKFAWNNAEANRLAVGDINVAFIAATEDNYFSLRRLGIEIRNNSPRVVSISDLAGRLTLGDVQYTIRSISGENRLTPGETSFIALDIAKQAEQAGIFFGDSAVVATKASFTLFDIPASFDHNTGALLKKENITWDFTFTPGSRGRAAVTEPIVASQWIEIGSADGAKEGH